MESWKMDQLLSPVASDNTRSAYAVFFDYQGMKIAHEGELVFIEKIPAESRADLLAALQQRKEAVDGTIFRLERWKEGLENRVEELEDGIDEADMGDEFSYYEDTLYEERETMIDDWETERDMAHEKVDELEDQIEVLRQQDYKLQFAIQLIGSVTE